VQKKEKNEKMIQIIDRRFNRNRITNLYGSGLHSKQFQRYEKKYELQINGYYKIYSTYLDLLSLDYGKDEVGILSPKENYESFCYTYTDIY
jgi:hypothetical protein